MIKVNTDVWLISETNIDESFPNQEFKTNGYMTIRRSRDSFGEDLIFYINGRIYSKALNLESIPRDNELILLYFTLKNQSCLCVGLYKLPSQIEKYFLNYLSKTLAQLTRQYEQIILIRDFNLAVTLTTVSKNSWTLLSTMFNEKNKLFYVLKPTLYQSNFNE